MNRTKILAAAAAVAGAAVLAPTAAWAGTAWSVSIGVPGVAVTAGTPVYAPYRPYHGYWHRPPVVYRPYYRPYVVPRRVYYAPPPVVVAPAPAPVPYYAPYPAPYPVVPVPAY